MKITLIRPSIIEERTFDAMEPLAMAVLKGLTPPQIELALHDERIRPDIPYDAPTDLVALAAETYTARRAYQIAGRFRNRGTPVVTGGYHSTFLPEEALQYCGSVVIGDAEGL